MHLEVYLRRYSDQCTSWGRDVCGDQHADGRPRFFSVPTSDLHAVLAQRIPRVGLPFIVLSFVYPFAMGGAILAKVLLLLWSIASGEEQRSFPATYRDVLLLCHDEGPGASRVPELPDPGSGSSLGS